MSFTASAATREVLEPFEGREYVPLPSLAERLKQVLGADFNQTDRSYAVRRGIIDVAPVRGRAGAKQVDRTEAERIVMSALIAVAAGVAIVTALQVLKGGLASGVIRAAVIAATST
jgi:hypothetical protein